MNKKVKYYFKQFGLLTVIAIISALAFACERPVSVSPPDVPPPDGLIVIESSPPDAEIYINGKDRRRITPDSLTWLATGDYEVTLKKEFWRDTSFMVSVVEGERSMVSVDYYSNPAMMGSISCVSNPDNAGVVVDDTILGYVAPSQIDGLTPGYHNVKFVMNDHRTSEQTVIVRSSEISYVSATLVDTTLWKVYTMDDSGLPSNNLTSVFADSRGVIWAGTLDQGLVKYDNGVWTNYRTANSDLPSNQVKAIEEAHDGTIWVGTYDGLVQIHYPGIIIKWNKQNSDIQDTHINDIAVGGTSVWFATDDGFCRVKMSSDRYTWMDITTALNSDLPGEKVTQVEVYGISKWAGTEKNGLVQFTNAQNLHTHNSVNGLFRNTVSALEIDRVGVVWAGHSSQVHTTGGLSRFNGVSWDNLSHIIHGEDVSVIYADSKNQKWIGTSRALYVIINANITRSFEYSTTGLDFENVSDICEDSNGFIWIATATDGLIRVDLNNL